MIKKISQTIVGIPLRQTSPAAIERYLVQKVRDDLGEFKDLATIKPLLRIDKEDGDLSGNVTNGFGTVRLQVQGTTLDLPFIIHEKELLPFDVIRLNDQEVVYDLSKLRQIVNGIDKHMKENGGSESVNDLMTVADPKEISTQNGFLGTIMRIRDDHAASDANRNDFEGLEFGSMSDSRMGKSASAHTDVMEVFLESMDKLAGVQSFSTDTLDSYLAYIEKQAETESQKQIDAVSSVDASFEQSRIIREMDKLNNEKLVDISRVRSGNDVKIPITQDGLFSFHNGRVYHKIKAWSTEKGIMSKLKSLVVDSKGNYKFVRENDKVMVTLEKPQFFELKQVPGRTLITKEMYTTEFDIETAMAPFVVESAFTEEQLLYGIYHLDGPNNPSSAFQNTLFSENYYCKEVMPARYAGDVGRSLTKNFAIIVSKKADHDKVLHLDAVAIREYINANAADPHDVRLATNLINDYSSKDFYIIPANLNFIHLEKNLIGNFTKPDGYFKEGPLAKTAAYHSTDSATLVVEKDSKPKVYGVNWQFSQKQESHGTGATFNIEKRQSSGLSEAQAKKVLGDLGFDFRQVETFMEITRRNGRNATFRLPDISKAKSVAPKDQAKNKVKKAFGNIVNGTLNANNFKPIFSDIMADGVVGALTNTLPQSVEWTQKWDSLTKQSFETATAMEKIANEMNGETWHELSALTNLKYQLDKMAGDVLSGSYLKGADEVFESIERLQPAIEKHAHDLITFNRKQILNYNRPPINPSLIKEALKSLDGLAKYAATNEILKKKDDLTKEANFFKKFDKQDMTQLSSTIERAKDDLNKLQRDYRDNHIYLRSLRNSGSPTTSKELIVEGKIDDLKTKISEHTNILNQHVDAKNEMTNTQKDFNRKITTGIGLPATAGIAYAYENAKD